MWASEAADNDIHTDSTTDLNTDSSFSSEDEVEDGVNCVGGELFQYLPT